MTREELLNCLVDRPCSACKYHKENGCSKWNCVFEEPRTNVLDKIRAEIEKPLHVERYFDTADAKAQYIALNWCIKIIDKYKAESEDKE